MTRTRRRRIYQTIPNVSLTPLIDTALTLLVVFMVAAPVAHHAVHVDLPRGESTESTAEKNEGEVIISIDRDGKIYLGKETIDRKNLIDAIKKIVHNNKQGSTVYLQVDRRSEAGLAIELLTDLRGVEGVDSVAFTIDTNGAHP